LPTSTEALFTLIMATIEWVAGTPKKLVNWEIAKYLMLLKVKDTAADR
jgi:hypothetical protein